MSKTRLTVLPVCERPGCPVYPGHEQHVESAGGSVLSWDGTLLSSEQQLPTHITLITQEGGILTQAVSKKMCPLGVNSRKERKTCYSTTAGSMFAYVLIQFLSKCVPGGSPLAEQLQRQLCQTNSPHTVVQPARPQTTLGNLKPPALSWKQIHSGT